jgi:nucleoside-diphosphate-sugar epimerase
VNVFITGAAGYIGGAVARALLRAGHEVTGLTRNRAKAEARGRAGMRWVAGDVREAASWRAAAAGAEGIVHLAMEFGPDAERLDRTALEHLIAAAREGGAATLVYTSGVWVLGDTGESAADESATTDRAPPLVAWRPEHERLALAAADGRLLTAVVRPAIVFGGKGGLLPNFYESAEREGEVVCVGDGRNRWTFVHVDDLADLYVRLLEMAEPLRRVPPGERIFHAAGGGAERLADVARAASEAAGTKGKVRFWPVAAARAKLGAFADALALDQFVAAPRSETILGWRPRFRGFVRNAAEAWAEWKA